MPGGAPRAGSGGRTGRPSAPLRPAGVPLDLLTRPQKLFYRRLVSLWTSLEPTSATVDPGSSTVVQLRIRNTGDVVDEYRFEPVGDIAPWTTVEPQTVRLYPGTTTTVALTFAPPRTPDAAAGPNPYAVRITPTEHPDATTAPEGNLTITPFTELRAELVPPTVKGRFRAKPKLAVDNLGNTKLTASIIGSDNGDNIAYEIRPSNIQIEPGRAAFVDTTLKPRQIIWFGSKEQRPYTLAVQRSGSEPAGVDGTYVQRGFLPGWLVTALGVALALAITFTILWIAYKPDVKSLAGEKVNEAVSTLQPSPSPTVEEKPPAEAEKSPEPQTSSEAAATEEPMRRRWRLGARESRPTRHRDPHHRQARRSLRRGHRPGQRQGQGRHAPDGPEVQGERQPEVGVPRGGPHGALARPVHGRGLGLQGGRRRDPARPVQR